MKTKTVHKYALKLAAVLALLCALLCFALSSEAGNISDDPADSYFKETAEYEDSTLSLWFEHAFKKKNIHHGNLIEHESIAFEKVLFVFRKNGVIVFIPFHLK